MATRVATPTGIETSQICSDLCCHSPNELSSRPRQDSGSGRTSTDVLIAMPGVGTACAKAKALDGDKLTAKAVERLFKKAAGPYVKQRTKNP